ncbi:MAG: hypothetical protein JJT94_06345 [Bernardetiaceae bacterium]|nr:hypothetical protein [Bernardetiaceae bacterium]
MRILFVLIFALVFLSVQGQALTLNELIALHESKDSRIIDKELSQKGWHYLKSDTVETDINDMWAFELDKRKVEDNHEAHPHEVQAVLFNAISEMPGIKYNQTQVHFREKKYFDAVLADFDKVGLVHIKDKANAKDNSITHYYRSDKYFAYTVTHPTYKLPYWIMIALLDKDKNNNSDAGGEE